MLVRVTLSRELDEDDEITEVQLSNIGRVVCPRLNKEKKEGWWLVIGDPMTNNLLSIKRIAIVRSSKVGKIRLSTNLYFSLIGLCTCNRLNSSSPHRRYLGTTHLFFI